VILSQFGQSLGVSRDSFTIRQNKKLINKIPFWKTNEIIIASKNMVSVDSLLWASLYNVDVTFTMHNGKPLFFLHSIKDNGNVKTRLNQLRAYDSRKGLEIAKSVLLQKIENENNLLKHLDLKPYEQNKRVPSPSEIASIEAEKLTHNLRQKLTHIEENFSLWFYAQVFHLFPKWLRVGNRIKRNATDPLNNLLNLSYEVLMWKVMKATVKSKLEPYLGFLHAEAWGKPSLVCDLVEPFRPYIIHFLLNYSKTLEPKDFKRAYIKNKLPRYFLTHEATWNLIETLNKHLFEAYIPQVRNRNIGFRMQFETLIDEYVSSIAKTLNSPSLKIPETTFPKPLLYHQKQWTTSTSSSSFCVRHKPENPKTSCYSLANPKKGRKTPINHAEKG
jgi:CRISPR-associated protein Cas1